MIRKIVVFFICAVLLILKSYIYAFHRYPRHDDKHVYQTSSSYNSQKSLGDINMFSPVVELHKSLVDIPSVSYNETHVARFLQLYLSTRGYTIDLIGDHNRQNIYAYKGSREDAKVLLTSNIDHVRSGTPYEVVDGRIYGSGSLDAKACVAAQVTALEELLREREVAYNQVALLFVVGGEVFGSGGMVEVDKMTKPWKTVIFGKPSGLDLVSRHCGVVIIGLEGDNQVLVEMMQAFKTSIVSGTVNVEFADDERASVEIRFLGDEENVTTEVVDVLSRFRDVVFTYQSYPPQDFSCKVPGFETTVSSLSSDSPHLKGDFGRYLYGPGNMSLSHAPDEHVSITDLLEAVEGYRKLVLFALE
ncbi:Peptidase M20 domain-containing protein [Yarrowia sp. C11]|nr:Peptidase M20 domain-containing protein [Yarrowia sp. E02]KAG5372006.1 Peptidase M20 domain-containing protein [Yarrowia sp. C11]